MAGENRSICIGFISLWVDLLLLIVTQKDAFTRFLCDKSEMNSG